MQRIGREVAAVLLAQRAVSAGAAMQQQQQAMPALLQRKRVMPTDSLQTTCGCTPHAHL